MSVPPLSVEPYCRVSCPASLALPVKVWAAVVFLASDASDYVTGGKSHGRWWVDCTVKSNACDVYEADAFSRRTSSWDSASASL